MASLAYDKPFLTDAALIRAIRGQQDRVRQTHHDYVEARQELRRLCDIARRPDGPDEADRGSIASSW